MPKKAISFLTVFLLLFSSSFSACGKSKDLQNELTDVVTLNIGIRPNYFQNLVTRAEETRYPVLVASETSRYRRADISIRGSSSKLIGLNTIPHRIPFELSFSNGNDAIPLFDNPSVKLINCYTPFRLIAEYIALDLFSYFGIPTPNHAITFIRFNDVDYGLYLAVEDINRYFITKRFQGELGSLYKASNEISPQESFSYSKWFGTLFVKINRGSQRFHLLLKALDQGEEYEKYLDVDQALRFFACVAATGGYGSIFTERNNFLLYENNGRFIFLPWDLSEAFSTFSAGIGIDCYPVFYNSNDMNPLFERIMSNPNNRAKYHEYIRQINDTFLNPDRMKTYVRSIVKRLEPYFVRDHTMINNDAQTPVRLLTGDTLFYGNLLLVFDEFHRQLNEQLEGKSTVFYVPQGVDVLETPEDLESILDLLNSNFMGDPEIIEKVCNAYDEWHSHFLRSDRFAITKKSFILMIIIFSVSFVIVLFIKRFILFLRFYRNNRQKE